MIAKLFSAAAAAALTIGTPAAGAPVAPPPVIYAPPAPPPGLPRGTPVSIPFSPPLGTTLDYSYSRIDERAGERKGAAFDFGLLFERAGAGYRMTVTTTVRGLSHEQRADPAVRVLETPITYRLTADAQIVGMDGEDAYWRNVIQVARAMGEDPKATPASRGLMEKMVRHMRSLPDAERLALATADIAPVLEMAGRRMAVGERTEVKGERTRLAIPAPASARMRRDLTVTLDRADGEWASFAVAARYDEEATRAVMADLASLAPPDKRPDPAALPVRISDKSLQQVSRATGLSRFYMRRLQSSDGRGADFFRTIMIRAGKSQPR
ncbi:MAG TPA: hypothetical protein VF535_05735 [Allosphingosinicella sp.]